MRGERGAVAEPTPHGFTRLPTDINTDVGGINLCIRRGGGAPITDVAVCYLGDTAESVPVGFSLVPKPTTGTVDLRKPLRRQVFLATRRADVVVSRADFPEGMVPFHAPVLSLLCLSSLPRFHEDVPARRSRDNRTFKQKLLL